jgi:hypothetical protein
MEDSNNAQNHTSEPGIGVVMAILLRALLHSYKMSYADKWLLKQPPLHIATLLKLPKG